ncbi:hypothetical protein WJX74_004930 [Apatococcus lobatus]|uniref:Uncharacterized protein n=1 Tax=Apatococcus lobatus TaxID=904363 RepID=A0AAW1S6B3_9CHLO
MKRLPIHPPLTSEGWCNIHGATSVASAHIQLLISNHKGQHAEGAAQHGSQRSAGAHAAGPWPPFHSAALHCLSRPQIVVHALQGILHQPSAIKAFAREVCRNDLLNFGRLHLFFPDSRLALDLNTDKTLKEARFDRHFVRDLTWSRHQL